VARFDKAHREKLSAAAKRRRHPPEVREKIAASLRMRALESRVYREGAAR